MSLMSVCLDCRFSASLILFNHLSNSATQNMSIWAQVCDVAQVSFGSICCAAVVAEMIYCTMFVIDF